ncbi:MAG: DNA polymerase III subunit delta [Oscillospiraceae bacterium]|nr:DNA polymerase III subunit delta [Oscillospiraceae bacterium]
MPRMNEKEFLSALKQQLNSSLFLFYGADEYSKNVCFRRLIKSASPDGEPTFFDGQALDLKRLSEECQSVSFFSDEKCVWVRNPSIESFSPSQLESLYTIISEKPDSTCLIFVIKSQEINTRTSAKWRKFIETIESGGIVVECNEKSQSDVISMIINTAKKSGCTIERSIAENLADRALNDMLVLENDLVKLCAFALEKCDGIITADAVEHLTARQLDYKAYEIIKHIINLRPQTALHILDSLFLQQVDAISINSALSSSFLDIYRVKKMQQYNHSVSELSASFDYKGKDFKLRGAGYDAPKCTPEFLKNAILCLAETDIKLKSTKHDKKTLMERALIKIILGDKAGKAI